VPSPISASQSPDVVIVGGGIAGLAAGLRLPLIAGPVLSMLIPETVALALLPALSVAVPVTL